MDSKTTVGPFGGNGGNSWDDGINTGIKQIVIVYGGIIDSIRIEYDKNGQSVWSVKHGGSGGSNTVKVQLDFPNEYLTSVSGHHAMYTAILVINSLTFQSNKKTYGPFGTEQGNRFSFSTSPGKKIVGFHGRSGLYLDSIGAHLQPIVVSCGPFGGKGGNPWNDGIYTGIRQIIVVYGSIIDSIHVEYDKNGQSIWSAKHGGPGGSNTFKVALDFPNEYLTSVTGYHTTDTNFIVIHSLVFQSNKKTYGPFGTKQGNQFSLPTSAGGKIVGFHGRSGIYLDSIGAHVEKI